MSELLDCVQIDPAGGAARVSVIWLHGLGASGHDFEPIVPELQLPDSVPVRFVFPHAPDRPVTINNGFVMPAWFDITTLERLDGADTNGIEESVRQTLALIEREKARGVAPEHIVIAGFSQGGVIALHAAARYPETLAGVIALSTYLPAHEHLLRSAGGANRQTPLFMAHGQFDPVIPFAAGQHSCELARSLFNPVDWHSYPMEHGVCLEEIQAIGAWLRDLEALQPDTIKS